MRSFSGWGWALVALSVGGAAPQLGGCGGERAALRQEGRSRVGLEKAADAFWQAMRWADYSRAGALTRDTEAFSALSDELTARETEFRITDVEIVSVKLTPRPAGEASAVGGREGVVTVRFELISLPSNRVVQRKRTQSWVEEGGRWWALVEPDEALYYLEPR